MRSRSRKRRSKKSCTSSSLSGPPMFNIKIPVLGFLWKKEIFQIPVMHGVVFLTAKQSACLSALVICSILLKVHAYETNVNNKCEQPENK